MKTSNDKTNLFISCPTREIAAAVMQGIVEDGKSVGSIPIHRIIENIAKKVSNTDRLDKVELDALRAKSPAVLMWVPLKLKGSR